MLLLITRLFFIFLISHFFIYAALASEAESNIKFERFSVEDGLAQSNVFSTFIDSQGFLWAGTEDGLSRFDGYTFRTFKHQPNDPDSISSNLVFAIDEDNQGNLWLGTQGGGLNKFNPRTEKFSHYSVDTTSPLENHIRSVVVDSRNNVWIATIGGAFYLFDALLGTFKQYHLNDHQDTVSDGRIIAIIEDKKGSLWIGTKTRGLFHFNTKNHQFTHYYHDSNNPKSLTSNYVHTITEDKSGHIWIGTFGGGLNKFDPKSKVFQSSFSNDMDSLRHENITFIKEDSSGYLWVGTFGQGLYRYESSTHSLNHYLYNPSDLSTISDDIPFTFSEDKQGNIWIGTLGGGLNRFNPSSKVFSHYRYNGSKNKGLSQNDVRAITEDSYGNYWVGTIGGGLNRFDSKTQVFESYSHSADVPSSLSNNNVMSIKFDSNKNLWVGTRGGLNKYNYQTNDFTKVIFKGDNALRGSVRSIIEDNQGNLWFGSAMGDVLIFNPKTLAAVSYQYNTSDPASISNSDLFTIFEDSQSNIWVGTFGGGLNLFHPESQSFTHYLFDKNNASSISDNEVLTLFEDSKHRLWIGTYGGGLNLFDIKTGIFTHFKEKDGLANNVVYGILEDNNNNLWISTNKGLSKFNPETGVFKNYDVGDGLQGNEFNSNAAYKNSKGELYFGGFNGFNKFDPKNIIEDKQPPRVVITDMLLLNRTVPIIENKVEALSKSRHFTLDTAINLTKKIVLSHQDNILTFEFSALHFTNTKKNKFSYQLVGWDKDWVNSHYKNRRATYTNLPSGDYTFRVKASNADGYWNEEGVSLDITVLAPPWKTWWAYSLYGVFLLCLVLLFIRSQRKNVLFEQGINAQLESKVAERTSALKQSNNTIRVLSDISSEISANLELDKLMDTVYKHLKTLMQVDVFCIGIYDHGHQHISFEYPIENKVRLPEFIVKLTDNNRPAVWCLEHQKSMVMNDYEEDFSRYFDSSLKPKPIVGKEVKSVMYWPLVIGKKIIGVLTIQSYQKNAYNEHQQEMIKTLTSTIAIALDNANFYHEIAQQKNEVEAKNKEILDTQKHLLQSSKMASIGTMTAGIAHEINNPTNFAHAAVYMMSDEINVIKSFLKQLAGGENAEPEVLKSFDEKFTKLIELTKTAAEGTTRIKTIVEDLRTFARIDDAKQATVKLSDLLKSTVHLVQTQYDDIIIDTQFDYEPSFTCFPSKLNQVFMNIIVNACQAIEEKRLSENTLEGKVIIKMLQDNNKLVLSFEDNGCGMNEATLQRMFEPFFTTKDVGSGTGLGMAISFGIIEDHGGYIDIKSIENEGTKIRLSFEV